VPPAYQRQKDMRQGQQNRRGRGRGGGRKPQNPLARNYESNGPDVKIRGTAAHIAEKYMSLARDALASGDLVSAESYLQHAEHYNRIIMAAQTQFGGQPSAQAGEGPNGGGSYRNSRWNSDEENADDEAAEAGGDIRAGGGGEIRAPAGGQDRDRHAGDREHHPGGRDRNRHGGNGHEASREQNGADQPEAAAPDDTAPDPVS
jgi:Domain of unknown function (DUF4167)